MIVRCFRTIPRVTTDPSAAPISAWTRHEDPMDRYLAIESFVRVAESGSFAEAARQMRISRSVMTARIQQLQAFVGAPLFLRNTRSVRLSELGQTFLRDCSDLVGRTNEVVDQMREVGTSPVGRLRVH